MTIRVFLCLLLPLSLQSLDVNAAKFRPLKDGCDGLRDVVIEQIGALSASTAAPGLLRQAKGEPIVPDPPTYCMDTATATTAAFSAAMHGVGIQVIWNQAGISSGDHCASRLLSECYPRLALAELATARQLRFVHDAWAAVAKSVTAAMPYGAASDMTVFESKTLELTIRRRLLLEYQPVVGSIAVAPPE